MAYYLAYPPTCLVESRRNGKIVKPLSSYNNNTKRLTRTISIITMLASLVLLNGCSTKQTITPNALPVCSVYTKAQWQSITSTAATLPNNSPLILVLHDYLDLRAKLKLAYSA